ncbi:DUF134 domain-containing protein [Methanohalophilus sp.]|uniref:DUF134 domain-containing protein n=1 Tax=Methanohalophilus sp. TaxID=1966352 RepID=UPI002632B8F1|nr:DUF134 domain-containing protein [Methanohalophilus sp.]MDK2893049.1 uncharacterized protein [Methanohalophilus sp.]
MVRPRKRRMVDFEHNIRHFKPSGIGLKDLEEVNITIDELECLRLSYLENMKQDAAACKMQIHQSTFQRTLRKALEKISDALVNGKAIRIEGGNYSMPGRDGTGPTGSGPVGGHGQGRGRGGFGGQNVQGAGRGGFPQNCRCPSCGNTQPHQPGVPCSQVKCLKCGSPMVRA